MNTFDAIQNLGFPIICCIILFYQNQKQHDQFQSTIDSLRAVIEDNNRILQEFVNETKEVKTWKKQKP